MKRRWGAAILAACLSFAMPVSAMADTGVDDTATAEVVESTDVDNTEAVVEAVVNDSAEDTVVEATAEEPVVEPEVAPEPEPAAEPAPVEPEIVPEPVVEEAPAMEGAPVEPEPASDAPVEESAPDPEPAPVAAEPAVEDPATDEPAASQVVDDSAEDVDEGVACDAHPDTRPHPERDGWCLWVPSKPTQDGSIVSVPASPDSLNRYYQYPMYSGEHVDGYPLAGIPIELSEGQELTVCAGTFPAQAGTNILVQLVDGQHPCWDFEYIPPVVDPAPIEVDTDEPRFDGEPVVDYENPVMPVPLEEEYYTFTPGRLDYGDDQRGVVAVTYEAEPKEGVVFIEGAQTEFTVEFPWVNFPTPDPKPVPVYVEWASVIDPLAGVPACSDDQLPEVEGVEYFVNSSSIDLETGVRGVTVIARLMGDSHFFIDEDGNVLEVRKRVFYEEFDQSECGWWAPLPPTDEEEDEGTDKEKPNGDSGKTPVIIIEVVNDEKTDKNEEADRREVVVDSREDDDKPATSQRQLAQTGSAGTAMLALAALAAIIVGSIITARRRRSQ